ncbi:MAG: hypothetical protein GF313_11140 [Caldithrix sp.]|nr:hypothetical protein [Caldithrix sp.]
MSRSSTDIYKFSSIPIEDISFQEMNRDEIIRDFKELEEENDLDWFY